MLPQFQTPTENNQSSFKINKKYIYSYIFKMCRYRQMDFDLAAFLMLNSLKSPSKLYQHTKRMKQIRN